MWVPSKKWVKLNLILKSKIERRNDRFWVNFLQKVLSFFAFVIFVSFLQIFEIFLFSKVNFFCLMWDIQKVLFFPACSNLFPEATFTYWTCSLWPYVTSLSTSISKRWYIFMKNHLYKFIKCVANKKCKYASSGEHIQFIDSANWA